MRDAVPFACEQPASFPACHSPCALMAVRAVHIITCASNAYMPIQTGPAYGYHADAKVTRCAHRAWGPSPASRHAQAALSAVHQGSLKVQAGSRTFTLSPHTATRPGWQPHLCIVTPYSHHARLAATHLHCHPIQPPDQAGSHTFALSPHTATMPGCCGQLRTRLTPPWWFTILQGAHRRGGGLHVACAATSPRACASESDAARQQGYVEGHVLVPLDTCRHLTNA